jgi:thiol-disulfide isomerase/thioredoxin
MGNEAAKSGPRRQRLRAYLLNAVFIVAAFVAVTAFQTRNMLATDREPAPGLRAPTLTGETFDLSASRGKPVLVYFFAPWCGICAASADNVERLRKLVGDDDLDIVTVALDWNGADEVREYVARHGVEGPVVLADTGVARAWQVYAFPTYYVLDSELGVARRDMGYSTQLGLLWRVWTVD